MFQIPEVKTISLVVKKGSHAHLKLRTTFACCALHYCQTLQKAAGPNVSVLSVRRRTQTPPHRHLLGPSRVWARSQGGGAPAFLPHFWCCGPVATL